MKPARIAGHAAGSVVASTVWVAGISTAGSDDWRLYAVGVLPQVVAAISLVLQHHADAVMAPSGAAAQQHRRPSPNPRPVMSARTRQVTR